jgi:hypothetical protein
MIEFKDNIPLVFGYPLWFGNIKRRVAKKYLNRWSLGRLVKHRGKMLASLDIGDLINDCTGFNGEIVSIDPSYRRIAGGYVLVDIDLATANTGCSLVSCGVTEERPREEIEAATLSFLQEWTLGGQGAIWYGGADNPEYKEKMDHARWLVDILKSGGHITDERGRKLKEYTAEAYKQTLAAR